MFSENMKLTIDLEEDVYRHLELRCAIDDMRIDEGAGHFLTELVSAHKDKRPIQFDTGDKGRPRKMAAVCKIRNEVKYVEA